MNEINKSGVAPTWSRPLTSSDTFESVPFRARPIRHWRKQLQPRNNTGRTGVIFDDRPGSYLLNFAGCECSEKFNFNISNDTKCRTRIRSAMTEKLINSQNENVAPTKRYSFSTKQYLESKCKTYKQNLPGAKDPTITYTDASGNIIHPSNDVNGTQVRLSTNCYDGSCKRIIYKPSNHQYFNQGAVSASTRLERLKLQTVNKNGASFKTAWGQAAANAGKYRADGLAPYFIKSKNNVCEPKLYKRIKR